ncbi:low affinity immunoglobulin gamma Fc region receptor III-like isoform X2 [Saccopteryx leptura]|uniref:low affinity immunoglobulin gamma Fc region receptor III-like isoform X2 n=1 Tax=Saccopteryx leptura TaxID=249018 RepID=UPI00339C9398
MLPKVHAGGLWLLQPLGVFVLLLLASADREAARFPKAVVSLEPPWFNVLQEDNVTLNCLGAHSPGDRSTQWFHNGIIIPNRDQPSYSFKASLSDQGDYSCQTNQTNLSDPVYLNVTADWLLLQTPRLVFQEGEPIVLRCHRWRNQPLHKVIFYQDGKHKGYFKKYSVNSSFSIPQAKTSHSGKYHCTSHGISMVYTSHPVSITVRGPATLPIPLHFPLWPHIAFCLVMGLLFAVDTGLYFFVRKELQSSMRDQSNDKVTWSKNLEDK